MTFYYSASKNAFYSSDVTPVASMPTDGVALTDSEYSAIMQKQAEGYRIVANTSTGKPQALAQGLTDATRTTDALDSEVVHLAGAETIAGVKTFTDSPKVERVNPYVDIVQTDITKGTAPSATSYAGVRFGGSEGANADDKQMGALLHNYYANGSNIMRLQVTKPEAGSTETASVSVAYGADGVPYATAPTPVNEDDNSTKVATTAWVKKKADKYLPLAGGTMQGKLKFLDDGAVWSDGTDLLVGDTSGALLRLRNLENPELPGVFQIRASDGADKNVYLIGTPDGTLTWGGNNVITSAGGTLTGTVKTTQNGSIARDGTSGYLGLFGSGTDWWNKGANICLYGVDASNPGQFHLTAISVSDDGTTSKTALVGKGDGTLTWNAKQVLTTANGLPLSGGTLTGTLRVTEIRGTTNDGSINVMGSTTWGQGAYITLFGQGHASNPSVVQLNARNMATGEWSSLVCKPDGTLTWCGKNVLTELNGNVVVETWKSGNNWYRKWSDGWIEQGGSVSYSNTGTGTATFSTAFTSTPTVMLAPITDSHGEYTLTSTSNTNFVWKCNANRTGNITWYACGF